MLKVRQLLKAIQNGNLSAEDSVLFVRLLFQEGYDLEDMIENLIEQFSQEKKLTMSEALVDFYFSYDPQFARRLSQNIRN